MKLIVGSIASIADNKKLSDLETRVRSDIEKIKEPNALLVDKIFMTINKKKF